MKIIMEWWCFSGPQIRINRSVSGLLSLQCFSKELGFDAEWREVSKHS